jgi:hypothetical protein
MIDKTQDLFVQIDALLGRRSSEALSEKPGELDDFPLLTEIVQVEPALLTSAAHPSERRIAERRTVARRQAESVDPDASELAALEQRMKDLIVMQHEQLDALIRQIVREELQKK